MKLNVARIELTKKSHGTHRLLVNISSCLTLVGTRIYQINVFCSVTLTYLSHVPLQATHFFKFLILYFKSWSFKSLYTSVKVFTEVYRPQHLTLSHKSHLLVTLENNAGLRHFCIYILYSLCYNVGEIICTTPCDSQVTSFEVANQDILTKHNHK